MSPAVALILEALKDPAIRAEVLKIATEAPKAANDVAVEAAGLIDVAAAARLLGLTKASVRARCYRETLPHTRVGKVLRFKRFELLALIERGRR